MLTKLFNASLMTGIKGVPPLCAAHFLVTFIAVVMGFYRYRGSFDVGFCASPQHSRQSETGVSEVLRDPGGSDRFASRRPRAISAHSAVVAGCA